MKVAIIGAGWYGCHIASTLKEHCSKLVVFEKNKEIFTEASGNNQFRLHQGLHYPRASKTRHESRDGFLRFTERYPNFSKEIKNNIYVVPKLESLMDFNTYFSIMYSSGLEIEKIPNNSVRLKVLNVSIVEGAISCKERIVLTQKAKRFFEEKLVDNIELNQNIKNIQIIKNGVLINSEKYDYVVDCTWGAIHEMNEDLLNYYYEPTILLYYKKKERWDFPAITMMDGMFGSIYPTEKKDIYTLSSVKHTPCGKFETKKEAYKFLGKDKEKLIEVKRNLIENEIIKYIPNFKKYFEYISPQFAIKTKPKINNDDRSVMLSRNGNYFNVMPGKIDNIFHASDWILGEMNR
jgi:hypothetical protein